MIRKMHRKAWGITEQFSEKAFRLFMDTVIMLLMAAVAIWMLSLPALAAEQNGRAEPLTVVTQELPANFQATAANAGLDVVGIERLLSLGDHILTVQTTNGDTPERMLQVLNATFPTMEFVDMNGTDEMFELVEN